MKLSELDEEGLIQLSVSVELAQKVLQLLSKLCQGCTRSDLQSSHIYLKYSCSKGKIEQNCQNGDVALPECGSLSEAMASRKPKKELFSTELPSAAPSTTEKTDTQLINELLKVEGLAFPDTLDEKVKGKCQPSSLLASWLSRLLGKRNCRKLLYVCFWREKPSAQNRSVVVLLKGRVFEVGLLLRECFRNLSFHPGQSSAV